MTPDILLETCLADIAADRKTLAECVAEHPHLEPHLRVTQHLRAAISEATPTLRPETMRRFEAQLRRAAPARRFLPRLNLVLRRFVLASFVVTLFAGSGYGVALAAPNSTPGEPLYVLKRTLEAVATRVIFSSRRPDVYLIQAEQRLAEIEILVKRRDASPALLEDLLAEMVAATTTALAETRALSAEHQKGILTDILYETHRQSSMLEMLALLAPASTWPHFEQTRASIAQHQAQAATWRDQLFAASP